MALAQIPELEKPATTIGQLAKLWRSEECTFCGNVGKRRVNVAVD